MTINLQQPTPEMRPDAFRTGSSQAKRERLCVSLLVFQHALWADDGATDAVAELVMKGMAEGRHLVVLQGSQPARENLQDPRRFSSQATVCSGEWRAGRIEFKDNFHQLFLVMIEGWKLPISMVACVARRHRASTQMITSADVAQLEQLTHG